MTGADEMRGKAIIRDRSSEMHPGLVGRDLAEFGVARLRDDVFDAVLTLWRRREREGWTKKHLAKIIGRDPEWVSANLRAPGNWTLRTAGELIQGLGGEAVVQVAALEDARGGTVAQEAPERRKAEEGPKP